MPGADVQLYVSHTPSPNPGRPTISCRTHAERRNAVEQAKTGGAAGAVDGAAALASARRAAEKSLELYEYTKVEEPVPEVRLCVCGHVS